MQPKFGTLGMMGRSRAHGIWSPHYNTHSMEGTSVSDDGITTDHKPHLCETRIAHVILFNFGSYHPCFVSSALVHVRRGSYPAKSYAVRSRNKTPSRRRCLRQANPLLPSDLFREGKAPFLWIKFMARQWRIDCFRSGVPTTAPPLIDLGSFSRRVYGTSAQSAHSCSGKPLLASSLLQLSHPVTISCTSLPYMQDIAGTESKKGGLIARIHRWSELTCTEQ
jgi:hypothetical protein